MFGNIRSPGTIANLRHNASVEVNVVDPFVRRGYRFKVMVRIQHAQPIDSPAYDLGLTEDEVRSRWERHFQALRAGKTSSPSPVDL